MGSVSPSWDFSHGAPQRKQGWPSFPRPSVLPAGAILTESIAVERMVEPPFQQPGASTESFLCERLWLLAVKLLDPNGLDEPWFDRGPHLHRYCPDQPLNFGLKGLI